MSLQDELRAAAHESEDYSLLTRAADALDVLPQVIEVHCHDIEKHAESFNEGYNTAMAQHLMSDHELHNGDGAEEWLKSKQAEAHAAGWQACVDARYQSVQDAVKRGMQ